MDLEHLRSPATGAAESMDADRSGHASRVVAARGERGG
jgi:hypothetical protein